MTTDPVPQPGEAPAQPVDPAQPSGDVVQTPPEQAPPVVAGTEEANAPVPDAVTEAPEVPSKDEPVPESVGSLLDRLRLTRSAGVVATVKDWFEEHGLKIP